MLYKTLFRLIHPKDTKTRLPVSVLIGCLFLQALVIPLMPLPGKLILDSLQQQPTSANNFSLQNTDSFLQTLGNYFSSLPQNQLLALSIGAILAFGIALALLKLAEGLAATVINQRVSSSLRQRLNKRILSRNLAYLDKKKTIDLMGRVSSDVEKLQLVFLGAVPTLFRSIPTILFTVIAMLLTDPLVAGIFLLTIPVLYSSTYYFTKKFKKENRALRVATNAYQEQLHLSYSFFSMAKSLRCEEKLLSLLETANERFLQTFFRSESVRFSFEGFLVLIKSLVRAIVLAVGCYFIFSKRITFGDFFLFFAYLEALIYPIDDIQRFLAKWSKTLVAADRLLELNMEMDGHSERFGEKALPEVRPQIHLRDVNFSYEGSDKKLFSNLSFSFSNPELIAIVGPSGVGKTTFMNLLNRLYTPDAGEILFSGVPLNNWNLNELRKNILLIGQENYLLSGTIAENIVLGTDVKRESEIWAALEKVNGKAFVASLPLGLQTRVGEGGQGLSGGQSRRLCLARGFLRSEAKVFIFDEPTSGLDPISAQAVLESLKAQSHQSLVFFSTHRMNEVTEATRTLLFSETAPPQLTSSPHTHGSFSKARDLEFQ